MRAAFLVMLTVAGVVATLGSSAAQAPAGAPSLDQLLGVAVRNLLESLPRLTQLVAEEDYRQRHGSTSRRLSSEVLLVSHPAQTGEWLFFRDVLSVDERPLPEQRQRLIHLFLEPQAPDLARARAIVEADQQYHIGPVRTAIANPFLGVALMHPSYQPSLRFSAGRQDPDLGPNVWRIQFVEREMSEAETRAQLETFGFISSLIAAVPARGTVWVDVSTGRIPKTDVVIGTEVVHGQSTTTFAHDPRLGVMLPVEMRTRWMVTSNSYVAGTATYAAFRRFGVSTREELSGPVPGR